MNILFCVLFLAFPALIIFAATKLKFVEKIGIVLLCYIFGMIVGNIGVLPESFTATPPGGGDSTLSLLQSVTICLALPLVLFSLDLRKWLKIAKKGMFCMLLACISIIVVTLVLNLALSGSFDDVSKYSAAAVSVYTGGTVNLASIKLAIGMSENDYIAFNTYDAVLSLIYIFFLSTFGQRFFTKVFKLKTYSPLGSGNTNMGDEVDESAKSYKNLVKPANMKGLAVALLLSAVIFGVSYALNMLVSKFNPSLGMTVMMLSITSLSIALSFVEKIRNIKYTFQLGMYIIFVFCFSVAASADLNALMHPNLAVLLYVLIGIFASMLIHAILCKITKIDTDTFIITSVSAVCSPPFVPAVAASLKNKEIMVSGLATGVVGYAIGNYLGIAIHYLYNLI